LSQGYLFSIIHLSDATSSVSFLGGVKLCLQIEHAQQLAPGTPSRFGKEGVVASMQVSSYCHYLVVYIFFYLFFK